MQTPVFEASTGINASINNGLLSITNPSLLYLPTIKRNDLVRNSALPVNNVYYLALNDGVTADALVTAFGGKSGGGPRKVLRAGKRDGTAIVLETGLDTSEIPGTKSNKATYITSNGLQEASFDISVDSRFLSAVLGPSAGSTFNNGGPSGESQVRFVLEAIPASRPDRDLRNYTKAIVSSINNGVEKRLTDSKADTATSVIAGPRASALMLSFDARLLTSDDFSRYGKTAQSIAGAAGTYRFIDTNVIVVGSTGTTEQLPIRIIQKE